MSTRLPSAILIALVLVGCGPIDTMKEGFAHSQAVAASLEKTLGVKSFVGFNWSNGSLSSVSVTFEAIPANVTLVDIAAQSKQAIASEFKQAPAQVVIAFALRQ